MGGYSLYLGGVSWLKYIKGTNLIKQRQPVLHSTVTGLNKSRKAKIGPNGSHFDEHGCES